MLLIFRTSKDPPQFQQAKDLDNHKHSKKRQSKTQAGQRKLISKNTLALHIIKPT